LSHIAVSNALLIIGMFMPKLGLVPFFGATLGSRLFGALGLPRSARSHDH
jgi:hypothetical protein